MRTEQNMRPVMPSEYPYPSTKTTGKLKKNAYWEGHEHECQ